MSKPVGCESELALGGKRKKASRQTQGTLPKNRPLTAYSYKEQTDSAGQFPNKRLNGP